MNIMLISFLDQAKRPIWEGKTPIYAYIREQGAEINGSLPDDEEFWSGSELRWVAGGLDGAFGHHTSTGAEVDDEIYKFVELLAKHSRKPKSASRKQLYAMLVKMELDAGRIDVIIEEICRYSGMKPQAVFLEAKWLAEYGAHRNPVKLGIALLGLFQNEDSKELLLTLGKHDEFTLYTAVAIQNAFKNSNGLIYDLAKQVQGWGKIHLVERLEPASPEIRNWLLCHGCQNKIMNEYLAYICARNGDLQEALSAGQVSLELFSGASDIIQALLHGGPAQDIDDYEHAPQVIADYVRLAREMCATAVHLSVITSIHQFLTEDEEIWSRRLGAGWTKQGRSDLTEACRLIISESNGMI